MTQPKFPVHCPDTKETLHSYNAYMRSGHWQRVKVLFRHSDHFRGQCFICKATERLHLHHLTYKRLGQEHLTDLLELCEGCHSAVHLLARESADKSKFNLWTLPTLAAKERERRAVAKKAQSKRIGDRRRQQIQEAPPLVWLTNSVYVYASP